jgi:hypothetical protein
MVYLCLPMANQGAYVIKKSTPFKAIPAIPVPSDIVTIQLTSDLPDSGVKSAHIQRWSNNQDLMNTEHPG